MQKAPQGEPCFTDTCASEWMYDPYAYALNQLGGFISQGFGHCQLFFAFGELGGISLSEPQTEQASWRLLCRQME
jgi:hypothetical protein